MRKRKKAEKIGLFVPKDTCQSGDMIIEGRIRLDGHFSGRLYTEASLEISEIGSFQGEAEVSVAEIAGEYSGNLKAREKFFLLKTGSFKGLLDTVVAKIEEGGSMEAEVRISGKR